jgi:hypothetical protein
MTHTGKGKIVFVEVKLHPFYTLELDGDEWLISQFCRFNPGKIASGTHSIRSWVDS